VAATGAGVAVVATEVPSFLLCAAPRFFPDLEGPLELEEDVAGAEAEAEPPVREDEEVDVVEDEDELVEECSACGCCDDAFCGCCWCNCCCCCGFCW